MIKSLTIKQIITINKRINIFSFTKVFIITYDIINTLKLRIFFFVENRDCESLTYVILEIFIL
jgi:hypothetical protein